MVLVVYWRVEIDKSNERRKAMFIAILVVVLVLFGILAGSRLFVQTRDEDELTQAGVIPPD